MKGNKKKPFAAAAFFATAFCFFTSVSFAAGSEAVLQPSGEWIIGPISLKDDHGGSYCSMKATYASDMSLVFARNNSGANSLAIEFGKRALKVGALYPLVLRVGPLLRNGGAVAATKGVAIVQLGDDETFFGMLADKPLLSARLDNADYNFALGGSSRALQALEACVSDLKSGKMPERVTVPAPGVEEKSALQSLVDPLYPPARISAAKQAVRVESGPVSFEEVKDDFDLSGLARNDMLKIEVDELKRKNAVLMRQLSEADRLALEERERLLEENRRLAGMLNETVSPASGETSAVSRAVSSRQETNEENALRKLLRKAGVDVSADASPENGFFRWSVGGLVGEAQEMPIRGKGDFISAVSAYIDDASQRCDGDFAHTRSDGDSSNQQKVELACMNGVNDSAAALLFIREGDRMYIISHEGPAASMEEALAHRDAAAQAVF